MMNTALSYLLMIPAGLVVLVSIWIMIGLTRFFFYKISKEITSFFSATLRQKTLAALLCLCIFAYSLYSTDFFTLVTDNLLHATVKAFLKFLMLYIAKIALYDIVYITIIKPMIFSFKGDISEEEAKLWLSEYKDFIACLPFMKTWAHKLLGD